MESSDLIVHILATTLFLVALAVAAVALSSAWLRDRQPSPSPTTVTSAQWERVVVMPTAGGRLEVATVLASETVTRSDPKVLLDLIDLGTTVS
jgi:hypothetical protein